ncbi:MAG TPA: PIN domain-containing protein, partial [Flavobacteriaceae bacterium]|nr:PIN domain-containing protein [Flavobacteriaceae bacterium]
MAQFILFVDTNVFLDALLERKASNACKQILILAEKMKLTLYTSPSCLLTIVYFLQKSGMSAKSVNDSVADLLKLFSLRPTIQEDFHAAINSGFADLENSVLYQTALRIKGIDYFVTSDIKDFKR